MASRVPRDSFEAVVRNGNSILAPRCARPADADAGGVRTTTGVVRAFWPPTCRRMRLDVYPSMSAKGRHANSQGGEMSQSTTTSATIREVVHTTAPTSEKDETSAAPVLITEQEVLFSTRVALIAAKGVQPPPVDRCDSRCRGLAAPAATAPAFSDGHRLPRAVAHGPRNGPAVSTFQYDWSGSPRLDALMHELGASLRRDFEHRELSVTAAPSPNPEPPSRWRPSDA